MSLRYADAAGIVSMLRNEQYCKSGGQMNYHMSPDNNSDAWWQSD